MNIFFNKEGRIKNAWWVVLFLLLLSCLLFPLIIIADRFSFEITMWQQVILIAVASVICQVLRHQPISDLTGKFNYAWIKELFLGLLTGAALMVLPALVLTLTGYLHWQLNAFTFSTILSGFSIFFWAAVAEELLFRGFMFQRLMDAFGQWPAQVIMAALFLLTHINNPGMTGMVKVLASINIFMASILFGLAFIKTKSLAMPLGLHFMANYMQGTILGFGVSGESEPGLLKPVFDDAPQWLGGGDFGMEASLPGLCFVIIFTVVLYRWKPLMDDTTTK
jgi:uncharacterized protein